MEPFQKTAPSPKSAYCGVSWHARSSRWRATIFGSNKPMHIGYFHKETDAAQAYDIEALRLRGLPSALQRLNFPDKIHDYMAHFRDAGIDLRIDEPNSSTAPPSAKACKVSHGTSPGSSRVAAPALERERDSSETESSDVDSRQGLTGLNGLSHESLVRAIQALSATQSRSAAGAAQQPAALGQRLVSDLAALLSRYDVDWSQVTQKLQKERQAEGSSPRTMCPPAKRPHSSMEGAALAPLSVPGRTEANASPA